MGLVTVPDSSMNPNAAYSTSNVNLLNSSQPLAAQDISRLASELLKRERQVDWVTAALADHLLVLRASQPTNNNNCYEKEEEEEEEDYFPQVTLSSPPAAAPTIPLDEVVYSIELPSVPENMNHDTSMMKLPVIVKRLLREFVSVMASAHKAHPFHNFTHAAQVLGAVAEHVKEMKSSLHPLGAVAVLFAALIHDVDHPGAVSNLALCNEQPWLGHHYRRTSVARQHAIDVAWSVFAEPHFSELRQFMFGSSTTCETWQARFRQVIVNTILATDISNTQLNQERQERLDRVLSEESSALRTTVTLEYLMRAAYVAHVMQAWPIYQKQNQLRFQESMAAFEEQRLSADPANFWYKSEFGPFERMFTNSA